MRLHLAGRASARTQFLARNLAGANTRDRVVHQQMHTKLRDARRLRNMVAAVPIGKAMLARLRLSPGDPPK